MDIVAIKEIIYSWDDITSRSMKKYIHYQSMRNFLTHFDEVRAEKAREKVCFLLTQYIARVQEKDYDFAAQGSLQLARTFLSPLSDIYKEYSNFRALMRLPIVLGFGVIGDGIFYFFGLLSKIHYLPIFTICLILYYLYVRIVKEPKGRVYGIFY